MEISRWCKPPDPRTHTSLAPAGAGRSLTGTGRQIEPHCVEAAPNIPPRRCSSFLSDAPSGLKHIYDIATGGLHHRLISISPPGFRNECTDKSVTYVLNLALPMS